ncbi:MAG: hypothetical protein HGA45_14485 [Chloroflexales bacterium]|nr:hypothetical protein [Chloroflexales bacterium]
MDVRREGAGMVWAVLSGDAPPAAASWPPLSPDLPPADQARQWLLAPVYEKVRAGASLFLAELRPVSALFLSFDGIDYEAEGAGGRLDAFVRWVQTVAGAHGGAVHQVTIGEKGSFLYATFGAPIAHEDDAARAVAAALELAAPPSLPGFSAMIKIGVASGVMRVGAYGGLARRTYGALGDATNLAARLMQAATDILCDETTALAARARWQLMSLPPIRVKGKREPVPVFRPTGAPAPAQPVIDTLPAEEQLTLKVASVIGPRFDLEALSAIYPAEGERALLAERLEALVRAGLLARQAEGPASYAFSDAEGHAAVYSQMLFAQRRRLHRALAEWYETAFAADLEPRFGLLAHHWGRAEDAPKTLRYLELAAEHARRTGAYEQALAYLRAALAAEGK